MTSSHLSSTTVPAPDPIARPPLSDDDSFIVFANSEHTENAVDIYEDDSGLKNSSYDKRLERVKECDYKTETTTGKKKKVCSLK